jgi:hypothetical protein
VRWIDADQESESRWVVSASLGALVFVAIFAAFNVVLEGPYMALLFWVFAGVAEVGTSAGRARVVS